ncbi:MAG TPA: TonB family protein, partial [Polyangiaceae bacterium]|nr:TonB family protein [Polyangiaceae bacterium]
EPPPPPPAPPKPSAPAHPPPHAVSVPKAPPPPAQAGRIIARAPEDDVVDLTGNTFVTGTASAYAGGTTTATGTSTKPVFAQTVAPPSDRFEPDLSRPVSLDENEWQCRWPREAEAEDIDEQSVVLHVSVRPDGSVASARLVSDPGHGFGAAALVCASHTRFTPARDRQGRAILAESPAIRVRFTR